MSNDATEEKTVFETLFPPSLPGPRARLAGRAEDGAGGRVLAAGLLLFLATIPVAGLVHYCWWKGYDIFFPVGAAVLLIGVAGWYLTNVLIIRNGRLMSLCAFVAVTAGFLIAAYLWFGWLVEPPRPGMSPLQRTVSWREGAAAPGDAARRMRVFQAQMFLFVAVVAGGLAALMVRMGTCLPYSTVTNRWLRPYVFAKRGAVDADSARNIGAIGVDEVLAFPVAEGEALNFQLFLFVDGMPEGEHCLAIKYFFRRNLGGIRFNAFPDNRTVPVSYAQILALAEKFGPLTPCRIHPAYRTWIKRKEHPRRTGTL